MKIESCEETYIITRRWDTIDFDAINNKIMNDPNYSTALEDNNPNSLANYTINQINTKLDEASELRRIKIKERKEIKGYMKSTY